MCVCVCVRVCMWMCMCVHVRVRELEPGLSVAWEASWELRLNLGEGES